MSLRVIFMGTPDFSVPTLNKLISDGHKVVAVYSQPPRPSGRGMDEQKSPVHKRAIELGVPVFTPENFKADAPIKQFKKHQADVAVVVAYGLLLPQVILDAPKLGCLNGHASLLPRWRGAAPIQRAIMAGDERTGVMIMQMELGLDTGPIAASREISITSEMTAGHLHDQLMIETADLFSQTLDELEHSRLNLIPQSECGVIYANKIIKSETKVDWNNPASQVHNHIRGLSPFPGAWCNMTISGKLVRVKILKTKLSDDYDGPPAQLSEGLCVTCAEGSIEILELQRAGKRKMTREEFLRGYPLSTISEIG